MVLVQQLSQQYVHLFELSAVGDEPTKLGQLYWTDELSRTHVDLVVAEAKSLEGVARTDIGAVD